MARLVVPVDWAMKAAALEQKVSDCAGDVKKIKKVLEVSHWSKLRAALKAASFGNICWYCEGEIYNSRPHIDHFRPKNGVVEAPLHNGYYWLAYEPSNYRVACEFCNSSTDDSPTGSRVTKQHHFPLLNESARALLPSDRVDRELPVLLDPVIAGDCELLDFDISGNARRSAAFPRSALEDQVCRVSESIRIYGLDRPGLDERRKGVMDAVVWNVKVLAAGVDGADEEIRRLIAPRSPHSTAAIAALRTRLDVEPVRDIFGSDLGFRNLIAEEADLTAPESLADLVNAGALRIGVDLVGTTVFGEVVATLVGNGRVRFGARSYATPDQAALVATGSPGVDGWNFWNVEINSGRVSLAKLREFYQGS
jgi:hypothetical protein